MYSPEIQGNGPEYWGNISEILGLKDDVEFAWTFEKDVEGNAEEASAAEKITYSTWCEGCDYPKFMDITKKSVGE